MMNGTGTTVAINAKVIINRQELAFDSISVTERNYYLSDVFTVKASLYGNGNFTMDYWSKTQESEIYIYASMDDNLTLLFYGLIDTIEIDLPRGMVSLSGRDKSSLLIDKKTASLYSNLTASEIATKLAVENGLTPAVTKTNTIVGNYYVSYGLVARYTTEWDLLTFLAQQEGFNVFVEKNELHFQPVQTNSANAYPLSYQQPTNLVAYPISTAISIHLSRSLTLARDVIVKIRSFNSDTGKPLNVTLRSRHTRNTSKLAPQIYVYDFPQLSPQQAQNKALQKLKEITQHEMNLEAVLPGDNVLHKNSLIKFIDSNTTFDQIYYVAQIVRTISYRSGYTMNVTAKNHDTNSQIPAPDNPES